MAEMTLKVTINNVYFQYQLRVSQNACLLQIWWFGPKSATSHRADKPNFLEFWVKMAKMTLKVKVNDLYFQFQLRVSQDACLVVPEGQGVIQPRCDITASDKTTRISR